MKIITEAIEIGDQKQIQTAGGILRKAPQSLVWDDVAFVLFIDTSVLVGELTSAWLGGRLSYHRPYSLGRAHGGRSAFFP